MGWLHSWEAKWLIDVSYVLDLFIIFNTTYIDPDTQIEVWSRRQVARRYVTNWRLRDGSWVPVDLLSTRSASVANPRTGPSRRPKTPRRPYLAPPRTRPAGAGRFRRPDHNPNHRQARLDMAD